MIKIDTDKFVCDTGTKVTYIYQISYGNINIDVEKTIDFKNVPEDRQHEVF